jgi:transcription elongation factor Elf1
MSEQPTILDREVIEKIFTCIHCGEVNNFADYGTVFAEQEIGFNQYGDVEYGITSVEEPNEVFNHFCRACFAEAPSEQMNDQVSLANGQYQYLGVNMAPDEPGYEREVTE